MIGEKGVLGDARVLPKEQSEKCSPWEEAAGW